MDRNFFRRVEVAFPIEDKTLRARIKDVLERYLADNTQAWVLDPDGGYRRLEPAADKPRSAQLELMRELAGR
jgi:polyphosphate kinase